MRFSKALSTAPALHQGAGTNTAPAAAIPVPEGRTGLLWSFCGKSVARGKRSMCSYWCVSHPQTGRKVSVEINTYPEGWGKWECKEVSVCVCGRGLYLAKHLKVNCRIKEYTSKVHTSSIHQFIIITEFTFTFFLYPATYLSCFRLKYTSC